MQAFSSTSLCMLPAAGFQALQALRFEPARPSTGAVRFARQPLGRAVQRHATPQNTKMYRFDFLTPEGGKPHRSAPASTGFQSDAAASLS